MRFFKWFLMVQCIVAAAFGTNWYVDNEATGANNGTSWANAWRNPTNVVWSSVNPGDTVYISGGTTQKVYTNWVIIDRDGGPGQYITVKIGQDPGHNGTAIFEGCGITMKGSAEWVAIDGGRSASFINPTTHREVINGPHAITNNIGFSFRNILGTTDADTSPCVWYFNGPNNLRFSYIEVSGLTNVGNFPYHETRGTVCYASMDAGTRSTNIVFEYLYIHDNSGQVFSWSGDQADTFDEKVFRYGHLAMNTEDHFETSGGWTIRDSVVGPCSGYSVHNDFFQFTGNFIKVYNNDIRESQNAIMRIQTYPDEPSRGLRHNIWFFNNLVTEKEGRAPGGGTAIEPVCMVHFDPDHPAMYATYSNIVFANNLFHNSILTTTVQPPRMCLNPVVSWTKGAVSNAFIKSCMFVNNLVVDKESGLNFPLTTEVNPSGYAAFTTNDFVLTFNTLAATNTSLHEPTRVMFLDKTQGDGFGKYSFNNNTNYPAFTDPRNDNFELRSVDTVALNTGTNLSAFFNFDALNRPRGVGAGGAWDRGPLEAQSLSASPPQEDLLVWINFNDSFTDAKLDDASGNGNHAYHFGRMGSAYTTNFPKPVVSSTTPGRTNLAGTDMAGRFDWYPTDYGLYKREGDYAGITNVTKLTNMLTATIMCWARYYPPHPGLDYSSDGNACLISAGTAAGILGTWDFGRYNQRIWMNNTRFMVITNQSTFEKSILEFPEDGWSGDTEVWRHYAVTWNNGVMVGYLNGKAFQTNDVSAIVSRLQIGANRNNPTPWIAIGCDTHGGTPWLNDEAPAIEYPNHGFMNGVIDDVRIFNRPLGGSEIQAIYSGGAPDLEPLAPPSRLRTALN